MRIGLSTLMIQRGKTGVAQYVFDLLRRLEPRAHAHQIVLFVLEEDIPLFNFLPERITRVSVPEVYRPAVRNILWHQSLLPGLARKHQLDLLHVPSYRRMLFPKPCALIATIHDLAPFHLAGKYDWLRMFYGRVIARRLSQRQDRIIAVSQNTARDLVTFFKTPHQRIEVIRNGLDHERFFPDSGEPARERIRERFGLQKPFFLYVARLEHPGKNHLRLIAAFEQFRKQCSAPWEMVLGGSDWHGAEVIHAAMRASPQREHIKCLGFVAREDLPDLYRAANAFVYPSLFEGFGLPLLEAMACACPVLCSNRGSVAEVVEDAALLVDPENVDALANGMARIASNEAIASQLRAAGLVQARKFDWNRTAAETLRVYEEVARPFARQAQAQLSPLRSPAAT